MRSYGLILGTFTALVCFSTAAHAANAPATAPTKAPPPKPKDLTAIEWVYSAPAKVELARTETTVAQYRACLKAGKCRKPHDRYEYPHCNWGYPERDQHPINCVDWHQANTFCHWAGGRLPSVAEWYAEASNNQSRTFPWGDQAVSCDYAIWGDGPRADGCGKGSTWPVCSKPKGNSVSGLCDLGGNVWEWSQSPLVYPAADRAVRGGSWIHDLADYLRADYKLGDVPERWHHFAGFRCARPTPVVPPKP